MAKILWFAFYPGDWLTDLVVSTMPLDQQGAYIRLLCFAACNDGIPANPEPLIGVAGVWAEPLASCWVEHPTKKGFLHNPRLLTELARANTKREAATSAANRRWGCERNADAMPTHSERNADAMLVEKSRVDKKQTKNQLSAEPTPTWVQEAMTLYESHIGMLPFGRLGKALRPAVLKWGWGGPKDNQVHQWFDAYCRHKPLMRANGTTPDVIGKGEALVKNTQFCSPEDFVKNLAFWREYCTPPAPDPKIIDARIPKPVTA